MKRIYILCEGPTEERFVKELLIPRLQRIQIYITPVILPTKRIASGGRFRGGVHNYAKIARELSILCNDHDAWVTSMLDYYQLPPKTPGMNQHSGDLYADIAMIERAVEADVNRTNLHVNLMVHEFESLLFADISAFEKNFMPEELDKDKLSKIITEFPNPEDINNSPKTAPSKRLEDAIDGYQKVLFGNCVAMDIGLERMMDRCPHFCKWINRLTQI